MDYGSFFCKIVSLNPFYNEQKYKFFRDFGIRTAVFFNSISNSLSNTFSNILTKAKNANRIKTQDDPRPVKKFKVTNELPLQFDLDSIKQKYSLTNEEAIQMESVSKGFVNMFFDAIQPPSRTASSRAVFALCLKTKTKVLKN